LTWRILVTDSGTIEIAKNSVSQAAAVLKERLPYADPFLFKAITKIHDMLLQLSSIQLLAPVVSLASLEHFEFLQLEQGENFLSEVNMNFTNRIEWILVHSVSEARNAKAGPFYKSLRVTKSFRGRILQHQWGRFARKTVENSWAFKSNRASNSQKNCTKQL
jgi:hypothetical protein